MNRCGGVCTKFGVLDMGPAEEFVSRFVLKRKLERLRNLLNTTRVKRRLVNLVANHYKRGMTVRDCPRDLTQGDDTGRLKTTYFC